MGITKGSIRLGVILTGIISITLTVSSIYSAGSLIFSVPFLVFSVLGFRFFWKLVYNVNLSDSGALICNCAFYSFEVPMEKIQAITVNDSYDDNTVCLLTVEKKKINVWKNGNTKNIIFKLIKENMGIRVFDSKNWLPR